MNFKIYQVILIKKIENYVNLWYDKLCSNKICFTHKEVNYETDSCNCNFSACCY